jgi:hypothetical protein
MRVGIALNKSQKQSHTGEEHTQTTRCPFTRQLHPPYPCVLGPSPSLASHAYDAITVPRLYPPRQSTNFAQAP